MRDGDIEQIHLQLENTVKSLSLNYLLEHFAHPTARHPSSDLAYARPPSPRGKAFQCLPHRKDKLQSEDWVWAQGWHGIDFGGGWMYNSKKTEVSG